MRPLLVENHPILIHLGLYPENDGQIAYEIYSETEDSEGIYSL